ncbi:hypothetical protein F5Y15DRAFT_81939 [Xylariaceae sp. FL0016]|nr:hypothetical protein F5Y15DRAFT_81939 [Xylariaceae sp. FL0016]
MLLFPLTFASGDLALCHPMHRTGETRETLFDAINYGTNWYRDLQRAVLAAKSRWAVTEFVERSGSRCLGDPRLMAERAS